jgi:hypothetical protein
MPPDVHGDDAAEAEGVQGIGDGLALRIEQAAARDDLDCDAKATHSFGSDEEGGVGAGGLGSAGDESCGEEMLGGGGAGTGFIAGASARSPSSLISPSSPASPASEASLSVASPATPVARSR